MGKSNRLAVLLPAGAAAVSLSLGTATAAQATGLAPGTGAGPGAAAAPATASGLPPTAPSRRRLAATVPSFGYGGGVRM